LSHNDYLSIDSLLNLTASLANALNRVKGLEAKLSANTKALEETEMHLAVVEANRTEEVAASKRTATQGVKKGGSTSC
jgi:predicted  nucleic acid-binding Zn-ribbon protein